MQRLIYNLSTIVFLLALSSSLFLGVGIPKFSFTKINSTDFTISEYTNLNEYKIFRGKYNVQYDFSLPIYISTNQNDLNIAILPSNDTIFTLSKNQMKLDSVQSLIYINTFSEFKILFDGKKVTLTPNTTIFLVLPTNQLFVFEGNAQADNYRLSQGEYFDLFTAKIQPIERESFFNNENVSVLLNIAKQNHQVSFLLSDQTPPDIAILSNDLSVDSTYTLKGSVNEKSSVFVNNNLAKLDNNTLKFTLDLQLQVGLNTLSIEAVDLAGNRSFLRFEVYWSDDVVSLPVSFSTN